MARTPLTEDELIRDFGARKPGSDKPKTIDYYFKPRDLEYSSSSGTVSRSVNEEVGRIGLDRRLWIEHNATINPGNSGGPLLDEEGTVVGINTLGGPKGTGIFWSLSLRQLKDEIHRYSPNTIWK